MNAATQPTTRARVGDLIAIVGHRVGESERVGEIVEVLGDADHERYRVRWDDGHESVCYPGSDAVVRRAARRRQPRKEQA